MTPIRRTEQEDEPSARFQSASEVNQRQMGQLTRRGGPLRGDRVIPPGVVVMRVLSVLDVAVNDRRLSRNVARGATLPRKTAKAKPYLTHHQVQALADASAHLTLVLFLAYTGLRWGEATGLRVKHVDALGRRVSVQENAVMVGTVIHVGTPKTHETRSVPYPEFLALPIAQMCEGKTRDAILFGDGRSTCGCRTLAVDGSRPRCDASRILVCPGSHLTTFGTLRRLWLSRPART